MDTVIEARALTRRFGDRVAVNGVDLEVHRGEVFGFLGPNGAGKSTLIRMLVGLLRPSSGSATVVGCRLPHQAERLRPLVGYMTQRFSLYEDLSVEENLEFAAEVFGLDRASRRLRIEEVLAEYGLDERRSQRPATLSGGWKQRLALAASTIHRPQLLVLDEPTAGVDPENRRAFWEKLFRLARLGTTVLVSTHYMDEAVRCHRLCVLMEGDRVGLGAPVELRAALRGRVVEVSAAPVASAIEALRARPRVRSVTQLGRRLRVLLDRGGPDAAEAVPDLLRCLEESGHERLSAAPAAPNLEDVFVALIQGERLETPDRSAA
jgi:ABC-2 type transport system ATP-binding protein